jgi:hypothetical protein
MSKRHPLCGARATGVAAGVATRTDRAAWAARVADRVAASASLQSETHATSVALANQWFEGQDVMGARSCRRPRRRARSIATRRAKSVSPWALLSQVDLRDR